ncbi:uncharacterized protein METZ01_LOCUS326532, partial [marine metagenome]
VNNYRVVAETKEIPCGERKRIEVNGQRITIFNIDNIYYAIKDTCPHKGTAPLIRGTLDGNIISCPNHGYRFDLKTGDCNISSVFNTKVYPVKVEDNSILIHFD